MQTRAGVLLFLFFFVALVHALPLSRMGAGPAIAVRTDSDNAVLKVADLYLQPRQDTASPSASSSSGSSAASTSATATSAAASPTKTYTAAQMEAMHPRFIAIIGFVAGGLAGLTALVGIIVKAAKSFK